MAAILLPKLVYDAGAGAVTLQFQRGPRQFKCYWRAVELVMIDAEDRARREARGA